MSTTPGAAAGPRSTTLRLLSRWAPFVAALVIAVPSTLGSMEAHALAQTPSPSPAPGSASATSDEAVAESLFEAGRKLMADGRVAEACPKFEESNRVAPSAGTLLNLGRCLELQGKAASAWVAYKKAVGLARATGQTRHVTAGEKYIADVTPHLSRIRVEAPEAPPGLVVSRGGAPMGAAALGVPLAVDPGDQVIEATAPGRAPWSATVTVKPDGDEVLVTIPPLASLGAEPPASPRPAPRPTSDAARPDSGMPATRLAGLVVSGVGVASLGIGVAFGVMTLSDASAAEADASLCPAKRCTPAGEEAIASAETKAWVSNVTLGVGAGALVAGGALVAWSFLAPSRPRERAVRAAPWASPRAGGIVIGGAL